MLNSIFTDLADTTEIENVRVEITPKDIPDIFMGVKFIVDDGKLRMIVLPLYRVSKQHTVLFSSDNIHPRLYSIGAIIHSRFSLWLKQDKLSLQEQVLRNIPDCSIEVFSNVDRSVS